MSSYDFEAWFDTQAGLDCEQIRRNGLKVQADAELRIKGLRPEVPDVTTEQLAEFSRRIKHLLMLLGWDVKASDVSDEEWQRFLPLCKELVAKGQKEESVLALF